MPSVVNSPVGGSGQQFLTSAGIPMVGGKLYSYAAGTTTPTATYTSSAGSSANTNPIILDTYGRANTGNVWLILDTSYKFVLHTSADVPVATWDNITGINDALDASTTVKGITKLSVAPASATAPIAVGDNDPRLGLTSGFRARVANTYNITSTGNVQITFDTEDWDLLGEFDLSTDKFTPQASGHYMVTCSVTTSTSQLGTAGSTKYLQLWETALGGNVYLLGQQQITDFNAGMVMTFSGVI